MSIWENLDIYKHTCDYKLIEEKYNQTFDIKNVFRT